jgi:hypothetical protein
MHQKALEREAASKETVAELEAKLRLRERQLFGRKSEKGSNHPEKDASKSQGEKKPRGQQRGGKGHGRRDYSDLPAKPERHDLADDQRCCPAWTNAAAPRVIFLSRNFLAPKTRR